MNGWRNVRLGLPLSVALLGVFAPASGFAAVVDLTTTIVNGNFLGGNQSTGCPVGWTCLSGNGPTSYVVTTKQYTAASDGTGTATPPNTLVPGGGADAATCPYPYEGACSFGEFDLGTYAAGTTYTITIWVGTPVHLPFDGVTPSGPVGEILFYWGTGTASAFVNYQATGVAASPTGMWTSNTLSFTPSAAQVGKPISFEMFINGGANNLVTDFVFPAPATCVI
jgi:hypothetical protein